MSDIYTPGYLEVICGPMFSDKTARLILALKNLRHSNLKYLAFKPNIDTRFSPNEIVSRAIEERIPAKVLDSEHPMKSLDAYILKDFDVAAFDEGNLFSNELVEIVRGFQVMGKRVIVSGADLDYRGEPFDPMPALMAMADRVTKLAACCDYVDENGERCGRRATRTQRMVESSERILVGDKQYEPRCLEHHEVPGNNPKIYKLPTSTDS